MTQLRKQLDLAREVHQSQHYPGDLAMDVLPRRGRPLRLFAASFVAGALAAGIVLVVWLRSPQVPGTVIEPSPPSVVAAEPGVPSFPEELPIIPPSYSFELPAVPSFPAWGQPAQSDPPASQESV